MLWQRQALVTLGAGVLPEFQWGLSEFVAAIPRPLDRKEAIAHVLAAWLTYAWGRGAGGMDPVSRKGARLESFIAIQAAGVLDAIARA